MRGSIQKRGRNSWRVRYELPAVDGKRRWKSFTVRGKKREAEAKLADVLASMGKAEYVEPTKQSLGAYLANWIDTKRAAPRTLEGYRMVIEKHLVPGLGHLPIQMLAYEHVEAYYKAKREPVTVCACGQSHDFDPERININCACGAVLRQAVPLSEQTLKHHHALLRKALRDATKRRVVPRCIMDDVDAPSPQRPQIEALDGSDNAELLKMLDGTNALTRDTSTQLRAMVMLSLCSGMRRGEVCGLKWDKIDGKTVSVHRSLSQLEHGRLVLKEPKTVKSRRQLTIPQQMVTELRVQKARQARDKLAAGELYHDQGYVFADPVGEPIPPAMYTRRFRLAVKGTAFDRINIQALRHSHASQLIQRGVNIKTVSERLGHSTIVITLDTYGHLLPGMDEEAASIMEEML